VDHQLSDERKFEPERRPAVITIFCPYLPVVRFHNGARDGQPHPHPVRLAGEERFEDFFKFVFGNARCRSFRAPWWPRSLMEQTDGKINFTHAFASAVHRIIDD
jgi:hypothetical protein